MAISSNKSIGDVSSSGEGSAGDGSGGEEFHRKKGNWLWIENSMVLKSKNSDFYNKFSRSKERESSEVEYG